MIFLRINWPCFNLEAKRYDHAYICRTISIPFVHGRKTRHLASREGLDVASANAVEDQTTVLTVGSPIVTLSVALTACLSDRRFGGDVVVGESTCRGCWIAACVMVRDMRVGRGKGYKRACTWSAILAFTFSSLTTTGFNNFTMIKEQNNRRLIIKNPLKPVILMTDKNRQYVISTCKAHKQQITVV